MSNTIFLKVTSAVGVDGQVVPASKPGKPSIIEVSELEAKNLLQRGKAVLATVEDGAPEPEADEQEAAEDLTKLNKAQLIELAIEMDIDHGTMSKAELITAIESKQSEAN